uniref:Gustatory receptor n=1 Tax=Megaselia scalaris TaxID=36166 RepID=T1GSF5_MEGSC
MNMILQNRFGITYNELCSITNGYGIICGIQNVAESYYGIPILILFALNFTYIIIELFLFWYASFERPKGQDRPFHRVAVTARIFYNIVQMISISELCQRIAHENRKIGDNLFKILDSKILKNVEEKSLDLLLQVDSRKMEFSAGGVFKINRSLMFTISGAATTYLIILVQFRLANLNQESIMKSLNCTKLPHRH